MNLKQVLNWSALPPLEEIVSAPITKELFRIADAHAEVTVLIDDLYRQYVETWIRPHPIPARAGDEHRKNRITHYNTLKCPSARMPLCLIWRNSHPYIEDLSGGEFDETDLVSPRISINDIGMSIWQAAFNRRVSAAGSSASCAGISQSGSRASVGREESDPETQKKYISQATRLVDAALTYGLVEKRAISKRKTHVEGTRRLHEMMIRVEAMHLILAHDAIYRLHHDDDDGLGEER